MDKNWTEEQIQFVKDNYMNMSYKELGNIIGKNKRAILYITKKYNLVKFDYVEPIIGTKFNRLTLIDKPFRDTTTKTTCTKAKFLCDCGVETIIRLADVVREITKSCGCYGREESWKTGVESCKTHGMTGTRLYRIWKAIKSRCYNTKNKKYEYYGGRGITICQEWLDDNIKFFEWAKNNGYTDDLEIDRIDNNDSYSPNNCRWVTRTKNCRNTNSATLVTCFGETKTLSDWAEDDRVHINKNTLYARYRLGWSDEDIITKPTNINMRRIK